MLQPLLKQLCSLKILQTATDWLQSECPSYQPDLEALAAKLESGYWAWIMKKTKKTLNNN